MLTGRAKECQRAMATRHVVARQGNNASAASGIESASPCSCYVTVRCGVNLGCQPESARCFDWEVGDIDQPARQADAGERESLQLFGGDHRDRSSHECLKHRDYGTHRPIRRATWRRKIKAVSTVDVFG